MPDVLFGECVAEADAVMSDETSSGTEQRGWLQRWRAGRAHEQQRAQALHEAIEQVVDAVDPRLRAVTGYSKDLAPAIERALAYLDELDRQLPPAIEISARAWSADPLVRALFANVEQLHELFGTSRALHEFFDANPQCSEAFVGLGATREERKVLGMALTGEIVQREVAQTTVGFTAFRLVGATRTEPELRARVRARGFEFLVGMALGRCAARHAGTATREEDPQRLRIELSALEFERRAVEGLFDATDETGTRIDALRERLARSAVTPGAASAAPTVLEDNLDVIREVFGQPERHLRLESVCLRLDRMNIKVESVRSPAEELSLVEVAIGTFPARVVVLARYPRAELPAAEDWLVRAERQLGALR
jgi:hypothetical protein